MARMSCQADTIKLYSAFAEKIGIALIGGLVSLKLN